MSGLGLNGVLRKEADTGDENFDQAEMHSTLAIGDRVRLSGGYDMDPAWLGVSSAHEGEVVEFIPGQNESDAAVVQLDARLSTPKASGSIVVLELRYEGHSWGREGTVHIELCDFMPEATRWQDRRQGVWVESHAQYERIG